MEHIVIIGGGFAGINVAKRLDKRKYHVTIIDKNNCLKRGIENVTSQ